MKYRLTVISKSTKKIVTSGVGTKEEMEKKSKKYGKRTHDIYIKPC